MSAQKDNSEPRRPGRPRGGKRVTASREQLLDIALNLFSRQGIANTSLNAIAKEAGVTPAMLHYYFNSREQLLDAMVEERFLPLRSKIGTIFADNRDSPVIALTQMVKVLAELAEEYRWFAPLWMQEVIGEMPVLRTHLQARFGDEKYQATLATIKGWQQEGKLNNELAPELLFTTLLSLVLVPFSRMRNDERLNALSPDRIVRHALAVIGNGMGG
ncbi:TetR/AcrR family transcriptional regulator [Enterobacter huaxiensis]|jgi:AcrR family transcriptional regulator|uniref:TetR/AcrR family transcriptional regulator n=1 Tax=Enterobacter huaxiensis TaxID=2494702 RepID=A0ABU6EVI6_9ENTR|nr:TetR/AcrR family transcriptional regulator [Enterobacter huaxiensis]MEB7544551.1 TetR/AcrR family transcriptional regulator [Enterobacter huaxiensis]MEB7582603.1 TetR/AcrR family transcriptional regulator [Enterobacter huaxiensis]MEB7664956.1 TetR/AcrR family transcriptional regulator [Enterobacter huaxiensis]UNC48106.1 TetR/AcrR family transcriptional regulator [Enterobacter huaxiensis]